MEKNKQITSYYNSIHEFTTALHYIPQKSLAKRQTDLTFKSSETDVKVASDN